MDAAAKVADLESPKGEEEAPKTIFGKMKKQLTYSLTVDVHEVCAQRTGCGVQEPVEGGAGGP